MNHQNGYQNLPNTRIPSSIYLTTTHINNQGSTGYQRYIRKKSVLEAYMLAIPLGLLGAHHFYLRRPGFGVLYFFTFGLLGIGVLFDWLRLPCLVSDANKRLENPNSYGRKRHDDAYLLWFVFGLLGFQHFYLKRPSLGVLYFFSFGIFGLGWLRDLFFLPSDVKEANKEKKDDNEKSLIMTYAFSLYFTGVLGGHHFYLRRYLFGVIYFFTFGLCGVGYVVDIIRVPFLVQRANKEIKAGIPNRKTLDDAYLLWFPVGFLGLHHFYLNRPVWGVLYFFTFGLVGIGWLADLFRIPSLVEECNFELEHNRPILPSNGRLGFPGTVIVPPPTRQTNVPSYTPFTGNPSGEAPNYNGNTQKAFTQPPVLTPQEAPPPYTFQ